METPQTFEPFAVEVFDEEERGSPEADSDIEDMEDDEHHAAHHIPSFTQGTYKSHEMRRLIRIREPDVVLPAAYNSLVLYKSSDVIPEWLLSDSSWKSTPTEVNNSNEISEILQIPAPKRTADQTSTLIHWLMSVWGIANMMGYKRCDSMIKEFKYSVFEAGKDIIRQGDRGLTFYIIIAGNANVYKEEVEEKLVGQLGKGKSFGEIALTQGQDLRTATVTAITRVELLSLHKSDYDFYVRDFQESVRRENFQILSQCGLFKSWAKTKIEKVRNSCMRKTYEAGKYIFRQGDSPEYLFIVVEGTVNIFKELVIVCKNRWPVGMRKWQQRVRKVTQPIMLKALQRGDYFGEVAILKNQLRSTSAIAATRTVLITLDKVEFLHSVNQAQSQSASTLEEEELEMAIKKYIGDEDVLDKIEGLKGGPSSAAFVGGVKIDKEEWELRRGLSSPSASSRPGTSEHRKHLSSPKNRPKTTSSTKLPSAFKTSESSPAKLFSTPGSALHPAVQKISRERGMTEQMRSLAMSTGVLDGADRQTGFDFQEIFKAKHEKRPIKLPSARPFTSNSSLSPFKREHEKERRNSMSFVKPVKRNSLQGIDNDTGFVFDPNRVVLRKNSVIRLGMVYEHIYQKLTQETIQTMEKTNTDPNKPHQIMRKASALLSNTLQGKFNEADFMASSMRQRSGSVIFNNVEDSPPQRRRSVHKVGTASDDDLDKSPGERPSRRGSMIKEPRLLNKSKITYRDAIQG